LRVVFSVRPEDASPPQIDVDDRVRSFLCVDEKEDAQAGDEATRYGHFVGAEQSYVVPAQLAGRSGGEIGVEVAGGGEEGCCDVFTADIIGGDHLLQELAAGRQNVLPGIAIYGDSASNTSAEHAATSSQALRPALPVKRRPGCEAT
jgi:hypothetical protein